MKMDARGTELRGQSASCVIYLMLFPWVAMGRGLHNFLLKGKFSKFHPSTGYFYDVSVGGCEVPHTFKNPLQNYSKAPKINMRPLLIRIF